MPLALGGRAAALVGCGARLDVDAERPSAAIDGGRVETMSPDAPARASAPGRARRARPAARSGRRRCTARSGRRAGRRRRRADDHAEHGRERHGEHRQRRAPARDERPRRRPPSSAEAERRSTPLEPSITHRELDDASRTSANATVLHARRAHARSRRARRRSRRSAASVQRRGPGPAAPRERRQSWVSGDSPRRAERRQLPADSSAIDTSGSTTKINDQRATTPTTWLRTSAPSATPMSANSAAGDKVPPATGATSPAPSAGPADAGQQRQADRRA